jgi:ATP synthase F1 gamma subunit
VQAIATRQLLPLELPEQSTGGSPAVGGAAADSPRLGEGDEQPNGGFYDFEPSADDLLSILVPQYAEATLYRALLEASASEHTARQRAMSAATENAEEFITTLRRVMNRVRQDAVTTEITEIVGGAEALRQAGPTGYVDIDAEHTEEQIA